MKRLGRGALALTLLALQACGGGTGDGGETEGVGSDPTATPAAEGAPAEAPAAEADGGIQGNAAGDADPETARPGSSEEADAQGAASRTPVMGAAPMPDSLVLLIRHDSIRLTRFPLDWYDLFHARFADQVSFPDPAVFPRGAEWMEEAMRAEAARTGVADAGLDWLLRLDGAVLDYYDDVDDAVLLFRQGVTPLLVVPRSWLLDLRLPDDAEIAPMESGARPVPHAASLDEGPPIPANWLRLWRADVRGRG